MNKNICSICQECFPTVEIDRIEEGMTGREVANLLYNNFDKLNKSKADICTKHELDKMLRDQYHIYNDVARQKFIDEVFYTFAKQDVKDSLSDFKELKDIIHDHLVDYTNPHRVTKDQVGLGQVDNTSDKDKPISDAVAKAIDELYEAIDNVDEREINYTINGYKINTNPILDGNDIELDNYTKVSVDTAIGNDDTVTKAIGKLEYRLEEEVDYRVDALEQEIAARIAADEALSNDITEETHNRIDEDNKLQQNITDLDSKYKGVTDGIKDDLQQHITEANAALNAEQQARQEADTKLQNNIDTESSARQEADKQLQQNIDNLNASLTEDIENVSNDLSTHINDKNNPHEVTKEQVGLGNLTNDVQVKRSEMGVANGVATLNESGQVPSSQLPSYVDDVLEYNTFSSLPDTGETGKIYITLDDNLTYRWSGTQYVEISKSLALGETSSTAFPGDRGKTVEDRVNSLPGYIVSGWSDAPVTTSDTTVTLQMGGEYIAGGNYDALFADDVTIPSATSTTAGVMSADDKTILDNLASKENLIIPADEEDITSESGALKFKDREYDEANFSGKGYKILRKNIQDNKNVLTQEMINETNTVYEIRYDFDLNGATINIPEGCTLKFEGGSFNNGNIVGNETVLKASSTKIIDCTLQGIFNAPEAYIEWFGGKADNNTDCLQAFNTAVNNFVCIKLLGGTYLVSDTLNIPDYCSIYGGVNTVITTNNNINYLLYVERSSYQRNKVRWNNFTIDCNNKANYGIYAKNITNNATAFLQNIDIFNAVTCGLHLETCQLINLYNVLVSSSGDKGIVINGCNNARIYNISAIQCEGDGITITKTSSYSGHLFIFGIYSENNKGNGVYIDNINHGMSLISGGWIEGNTKDGIYINTSTFLIQGIRITGVGSNDNRGLRIIGDKTQVDNVYVAKGSGDATYGEIYIEGNSFVRNNLLGNGNYNISTLSVGKEENLISNNILASGDKWVTYQVTADYNNSEYVNSKSTSLKLTANANRGTIMTYVNGIDGDVNISTIIYTEADTSITINIYANNVYKTERSFQLVGGKWNNISFKIKMSANFIYRIGLLIPIAQTSIWVDEINAITQTNTYVSHEVYGNNYLYSSLLSADAIDCTMLESNIDKGTIDFQPADLTSNDFGFLFFDNTNKRQKVWNGTEFRRLVDVKDVVTVGNSSEIPNNLVYNDRGFMYFDTTLNKPIWWNGTEWIQAGITDLATTTEDGLMSSEDKTKLDTIISTGDGTKYLADDGTYKTIDLTSTYVLPIASDTTLGGIKIGTGLNISEDGTVTVNIPTDYVTNSTLTATLQSYETTQHASDTYQVKGDYVTTDYLTSLINRITALEQALTLKNV